MKHFSVLIWFAAIGFFHSCGVFEVINSESFPENRIELGQPLVSKINQQSAATDSSANAQSEKIDQLFARIETFQKNPTANEWSSILQEWSNTGERYFADTSAVLSPDLAGKWASLNIQLVKISGEVRFGDELEKLLYRTKTPVLTESQIKSVIYTHVDDQIFINILGTSTAIHHHTTGGNIKLIQQTNYPESNEMTLKVETGDTRFLDVFIRIPSWAQNPTVQLGNVKYVAHPGEYCEISRKWKNGDQIDVKLNN